MLEHTFALTLTGKSDYEFSVAFDENGLPPLTMDEPPPLGDGRGPNAARLLGAAIGHCLSASLLFCLKKSRVAVSTFRATVEGTLVRNDAGRFRIGRVRVTLAPGIVDDRERVARCLGLFEDYCIVTASVREGIDVEVRVEPTGGAATVPSTPGVEGTAELP